MPRAPRTVYVAPAEPVELRPPTRGRSFLLISNPTTNADSVYYADGTIADSENGIEIAPGQAARFELSAGDEVPQGNVWLAVAAGAARTRVLIVEA